MYGVGIGTGATGVAGIGVAMGSNVLMGVAAIMMLATAVTLRHGTKTADVTVQPGDTLRALLEQLSWQTDDLKAVHIGYPVGGLFTAQVLDKPRSLKPYGTEEI